MGHPTERETAPEPSSTPTQPGLVTPAAATTPRAIPLDGEDESPYEPRVRAYEQRVIGTVSLPSGPPKGAPTQVLPAVAAPAPRPTSASGAPASAAPRPTSASAAPGATSASAAPGAPSAFPGFDRPAADGAVPPSGTPLGPLGGLAGDGAPSRLPKVAAWAGAGLVVLGGLYVGAQWLVSDKVPQGTTVAGVEIGGMSAQSAVAALEDGLGPRASEPIAVTAGEASSTFDPAAAGLALDADATVNDVTGFSLGPARLWEHLVGAEDVAPRLDVDRDLLDAVIAGLQESMLVTPVDGTVTFVDGAPVATKAEEGTELVAEEAGDEIVNGWLVQQGPFELPTHAVVPDIDQADTDAALAKAEQIVSGPVRVSVGGQSPELPPEAIASAVTFEPTKGALRPKFDGDALTTAIIERTNDLLSEPNDAHFEFSGGKPVIVGGEVGTTLAPKAVGKAIREAATSDERVTEVELVEKDPENTRQALEELGVKEVISSFSTPLTSDHIRTQNLIRGSQMLTGTLVKPGETMSLYDALSPITIENGYHSSGVVSNGVHTEGVGGGLSQMATTTYNAGFFAGFDDVNHRPHSYWFTRYPAGREATIYKGALDMKFKNDTPYGALMQAWVSGGELHVQIWSTKYYDVEEGKSGKTDIVPTTTVHSTAPDCEHYPAGQPGFSITNYRKVYLDGKLVKDEAYPWTYKPDNEVVCDSPKAGGEDDG
jgi:vancomycin resistance protein YoaR